MLAIGAMRRRLLSLQFVGGRFITKKVVRFGPKMGAYSIYYIF
jgi:hypothetical protein